MAGEQKLRIDTFAFIDDMVTACAAADLIVSRSGASTTAELACLGKPSILVPFPHATDNHQEQNARAFEDAGAATVILDNELTGERLADAIKALLADPGVFMRMGKRRNGPLRGPAPPKQLYDESLGCQRPQDLSSD